MPAAQKQSEQTSLLSPAHPLHYPVQFFSAILVCDVDNQKKHTIKLLGAMKYNTSMMFSFVTLKLCSY